ncbi:hypothetical protein GY45DRAFT_418935 [Cubamyces sp. BRFM 1775]|nr:hypothetical protein GY45DRAFT_418935 [Cubamyces sp. BRFM 1775]
MGSGDRAASSLAAKVSVECCASWQLFCTTVFFGFYGHEWTSCEAGTNEAETRYRRRAFLHPRQTSTILRQCSACAPAPSRLVLGISPSSSPGGRCSEPVFIHSHPRAGRNQSHASYVYRRAFPRPPSTSGFAFWRSGVLELTRVQCWSDASGEGGGWERRFLVLSPPP